MDAFWDFLQVGIVGNFSWGNLAMLAVGCVFVWLGIARDYEPLLLVPIGFGMLVGNIPLAVGMNLGIYEPGSVLNILYGGVTQGWYPSLIFLGIGAMTDFSCLLSNPRLVLLGAAAQAGIFLTFLGSLQLGFPIKEAAAIGIIGGADGPTAIFLSSQLAPHLLGAIAVAAYSYMALVPVIQPPIIKLLTSRRERLIRMKPSRPVSRRVRILFPVIAFILCASIAPGAISLLGFLFFGNLLKESGVTERLAKTARSALIDIVTILLGLCVGASTDASRFLTPQSIMIFVLGAVSFAVATASGVLFAKLLNLFLREKINPIIGAAGVSAVPDSARVCQMVGAREDPQNFLIMHAMAPNVAGVIGSAVAAGVFLSTFVLG
jgi:sodium ion-translocating decarboxylase beta subunit